MCGGKYKDFETPKQLLKVNEEVIIERTIKLLKENGIKDIAISTNNLAFDYLEYIIKEIFLSISSTISDEDLSYFIREISSFIKLFKSYNLDRKFLKRISNTNMLKVIDVLNMILLMQLVVVKQVLKLKNVMLNVMVEI